MVTQTFEYERIMCLTKQKEYFLNSQNVELNPFQILTRPPENFSKMRNLCYFNRDFIDIRKSYEIHVHYTFTIIPKEYVIKVIFILIIDFIEPAHIVY